MKAINNIFFLLIFILIFFSPCECCPEHCNCTEDSEECISCHTGYYDIEKNCTETCEKCPDKDCNYTNGKCINQVDDCIDNDKWDDYCNESCPNPCSKCNRKGECLECSDNKHYGKNCENLCNKCPKATCNFKGECDPTGDFCIEDTLTGIYCNKSCISEIDHCNKCKMMDKICIECEKTFYSSNCSLNCLKCPNEECNIDGECKDQEANCKDNMTKGSNCETECTEGSEGTKYLDCVECDRHGRCLKCNGNKYYGEHCEKRCENCPGGTCDTDGKCTDLENNCKDNLTFGEYCNINCTSINETCNTCNRNGDCLSCEGQYNYGPNCSKTCANCPEDICKFDDGSCIKDGDCEGNKYYGKDCQTECKSISEHCKFCFRNGTCKECEGKIYFGDNCTEQCDKCPESGCNIYGICVDTDANCKNNKTYGEKCDQNCTEIGIKNCLECNRDETCTVCVNISYYGKKCDSFCSHCPKNECNIDGSCKDTTADCPNDHFYGNDCNTSCTNISENCVNCHRNGICFSCKDDEYWGEKCKNTCSDCPDGKCYNNGTCINQTGICSDKTKTGERCDKNCTDINDNCLYCNRQEECFECKYKIMYGNRCNISCGKCPGNGTCENDGICCDDKNDCSNTSYSGDKCSVLCPDLPSNCKTCHRNETCITCINNTLFGENCTDVCDNCPDGLCHINGTCIDQERNCVNNSYSGEDCSVLCPNLPSNCKTCNRNNTCITCINETLFGEYCTDLCVNCPDGLCYPNGTCKDQEKDCFNNSYSGDDCSILIQEMIVQYYVLIYHQIVEPAIEIILVLRVLMKHYLENIVLIHVIIVQMDFAIQMEHV